MTDTAKKPVSIFALYQTDQKAEEDGKWFDSFGPDISMKIRRFSSKKSQAVRTSLEKPYTKMTRNGALPEDVQIDVFTSHLAEGIVVDWRGLYDTDGNEMVFSAGAAKKLFTDLPDLAREVVMLSINMDNFKTDHKDTVVGNS